jgi:folylpolyglutamate synthase/dihydropteroate synthase
MTPSQAQQYMATFINYENRRELIPRTAFKLDRVRQLLTNLGEPQKDLKIIHVAGSKGKGSVCAMTASILKNAGYKAGLYTSPHINTYRERIRILSAEVTNPLPTYAVGRGGMGTDIFPDMISEGELCEMIEDQAGH